MRPAVFLLGLILSAGVVVADAAAPASLTKAVTLYASFDEAVRADVAGGTPTLSTRYNDTKKKGAFVFEKGFPEKAFRIAKGKGIHGGALEGVDVLPNNGRIFFPMKGNLAYKAGGWQGALSVWIKTDPDTMLKTTFCDPVQITQLGANNGGLWFDFNNSKPRDLRMGAFPFAPPGTKPFTEKGTDAPLVWVRKVGFKATDWHHVVLNWRNMDTGKPDGVAELWIDGVHKGSVKDRPLAMGWDVDKAGIYVAVSYIGLLDELALFNRALSASEIKQLQSKPGMLAGLKKAK